MRRRVLSVLVAALILVPAAAAKQSSWALPQIKVVVGAGLMGSNVATFHPDDALTKVALEQLVAGLAHTAPAVVTSPTASVTMSTLDARLVNALGLSETAKLFQQSAKAAGLAPPSRFGTEATARLLGLRLNHPASQDSLELSPNETATRAEAAYSGAQALKLGDWEVPAVQQAAGTFTLPTLTQWQQKILKTAVRFIGYPYIWGGEYEKPSSPYGAQVHGGFDCSGFVWRVYKIEQYAGAEKLSATLQGRTTYVMSGEVPRSKRIAFAKLQPADVIFFGTRGPASKPSQVDHMGIYLGNGWFIHSSGYGVAIAQLDGWYKQRFAWGRRPLAEAGLSAS